MQVQSTESFIKYVPSFSKGLGKGENLFLNHLRFYLNNPSLGKEYEGRRWIYKTREQLAEEMNYSPRQIHNIVEKLTRKGIIAVKKLNRHKSNRTNYYTVDEEKLSLLIKGEVFSKKASSSDKKNYQTSSLVQEKIAHSNSNKCSLYITKNTNLEINKSLETATLQKQTHQVEQVQDKKIIQAKEKTEQQIPVHTPQSLPSLSDKPTTIQDMLAYWNKTFDTSKTSLSKQIAPLLLAAFKHKFNSNMRKWENYCQRIASSAYLTGETFNLSIMWALKYLTIDRIFNGELGVKDVVEKSSYTEQDALNHIDVVNEPERCKQVRRNLLTLIGVHTYRDWLEQVEMFVEDDTVCFKGKNKFIEDYIKNHLWKKLQEN